MKLKIVNSVKLVEREFKKIPLVGIWTSVFDELTEDAKIFISGPPKRGKSTFILGFVHMLASIGYKVLYIATEETDSNGVKYSVQRRIKNGRFGHKNLDLVDSITDVRMLTTSDEVLKRWDVIVFDSIQSTGIDDDTYQEVVEMYTKKLFIMISQVNNKGKNMHRKIEHDVDAVINVKDGWAEILSRFSDTPKKVQVYDKKGRQLQIDFTQKKDGEVSE